MRHPFANDLIRILLIEDDEDDYLLARTLLLGSKTQRYHLDWCKDFATGLTTALLQAHDVILLDFRLGAETGLDLLQSVRDRGCQTPILLLTGQRELEIELEAIRSGAADYIEKSRLELPMLERAIRYAIERRRALAQAAADQARLASFGADVGLALTRRDSLEAILHGCTVAMVHYLDAAVARIWICDKDSGELTLAASAGVVAGMDHEAEEGPEAQWDMEALAHGQPMLINQACNDPRILRQDSVRQDNLVGYACHPLVLDDRLVGVMSVFSRNPLNEIVLQEMSSVGHGIALGIERKRSEQALDASEVKYQTVVENVKEVIFQLDEQGGYTFLNLAWTEIVGYTIEESLRTHFSDYVHPEDCESHREMMQEIIEHHKSSYQGEVRYRAKDGTFRWMEVRAQPLFTGDQWRLGLSGTLSDITERKQAEAEIQKLAAFARCNPNPVLELAADGTLTYYNQAAQDMARELKVSELVAILPPEAAATTRECLRTGQSRLRHVLKLANRTLAWSFFPIVPSQVVHAYGADITEQLNLEAQLRHSQKLESIGQLAAGVAHDFNNILTIIQGHSDRMLAQWQADSGLHEPLQQISAAARRASALTRQLLMFSRKQIMQAQVLDLNAVIGNLNKMLHRLLGEDIALYSTCTPHLPPIEGDAVMIEQVLMNLAVNARDAMPKGGRLVIATSLADIDAGYVQQHPEARAGRHVCLSFADTGCGMPPETLARIFEPFFTTKEVGKGTGLGLATVYGIVKQHQGWVEVESKVNAGTTFRIYLPGSNKSIASTVEPQAVRPEALGGRETILLVEDEPLLRDLARAILKDFHYEVLEASNGHEAIRVWDQHQGRIDLLLTDMVMPEGMTGRELAEQLKSRKPDLKIVISSGYSAEIMGRDIQLRDTVFLQKPYPPTQLAQTVRSCLDVKRN